MDRISVIINTLNEEENIERAIRSTKGFADEVVVVDMHSDDNTVKIAKKLGARVYGHDRTGYVEPARNFAIEKAHGDWIFILDADEEIPKGLRKRLKQTLKIKEADYFAIPRRNIIFGKWIKHSRWWPDYNIRFFKKGRVTWDNDIHSVPITKGKGKDIEATEKLAIKHYHYESVEQFIERMNRYTSIQAKELFRESHIFHWSHIIKKPSQEFISRYFAGNGYKDGLHGLALASLQSLSELVLVLKLWQLNKFKSKKIKTSKVITEYKKAHREMNYWFADTMHKSNPNFINKIKRKFKLP